MGVDSIGDQAWLTLSFFFYTEVYQNIGKLAKRSTEDELKPPGTLKCLGHKLFWGLKVAKSFSFP